MKIKYTSYVIFDLEATCEDKAVNPNYVNEIIEIGAFKLDQNGKVIDKFSAFCKPRGAKITNFCTQLTSITQSDIDAAAPLADVLFDFSEWSNDSALLSWGGYDMNQIERDVRRNSLKSLIDVDDMRARHHNIKEIYADFKGLRKGIGIARALNMENIKFDGTHHRGIDDAHNMVKLFQHKLKQFTELI